MIVPRTEPTDLTVTAAPGVVYLNWDRCEYGESLTIPPAQARTLAAELLTNADRAEGRTPATVYRIDRR